MRFEYFARCAYGFEAICAQELKQLQAQQVRPLNGGVSFCGDMRLGFAACLWLRSASRVELILDRVSAKDADDLYRGVYDLSWQEHIGPDASIAVVAFGRNDELRHSNFVAQKVKDAICDSLRADTGRRPDVDAKNPDLLISVSIHQNRARIALDLSGEPLHRRGYRQDGLQAKAPLKETLAAALVLSCDFAKRRTSDECPIFNNFIDPLCGSGTLAIEAALIASDGAPGMFRQRWGFEGWRLFDEELWQDLLAQADERFEVGKLRFKEQNRAIVATDCDMSALALCAASAKRAQVKDLICIGQGDVKDLAKALEPLHLEGKSLVLSNPPYAQRLLDQEELFGLYQAMSEGFSTLPKDTEFGIISPDERIADALGFEVCSQQKFFNGALETRLYHLRANRRTNQVVLRLMDIKGYEHELRCAHATAEQFARRLRKVGKERAKWAKRNHISAYRVYDADLPDYAVAIDVVEGEGPHAQERYLRISEYQAPKEIDEAVARLRFMDVLRIAPVVLGVDADKVFSKMRRRTKGGSQYTEAKGVSKRVYTQESGYLLELDLNAYLDMGLFLDHRPVRCAIERIKPKGHFLNLFAYTGAASVHALAAEPITTTTVDMSNTYLDWARRNMANNGAIGHKHIFIKQDVMRWISDERSSKRRYDLIFVDPPTFSNSKSMGEHTWSVQRDHFELLMGVSRLLTRTGIALFSCNLKNFKIDEKALAEHDVIVEDVTALSIPNDFARHPKVHHLFIVTRSSNANQIPEIKKSLVAANVH